MGFFLVQILALLGISVCFIVLAGAYAFVWNVYKKWSKSPPFDSFSYGLMSALVGTALVMIIVVLMPEVNGLLIKWMVLVLPFFMTRSLIRLVPPGLKKFRFW